MAAKTTFPVSSGLLCQKHRDAIGTALWEFLWLIDKTTKETEKNGEAWGLVLGGKPVKAEEMALVFKVHPETVKKNLRRLERSRYIITTRSPYGLVIWVRKSIKFSYRKQDEPKQQKPSIPSNKEIIAELVEKYRGIPGIKEQKGDFPFIGRMYNQFGYDQLLDGINALHYKIVRGFNPEDPLVYLLGILKGGGKNGTCDGYSSRTFKKNSTKSSRAGYRPSEYDWERERDRI